MSHHTLVMGYKGRSLVAFKFAKAWHKQADIACSYLNKVAKKMKKWAEKKQCHTEYNIKDIVFVKLLL